VDPQLPGKRNKPLAKYDWKKKFTVRDNWANAKRAWEENLTMATFESRRRSHWFNEIEEN
jgi:hypothetical protein